MPRARGTRRRIAPGVYRDAFGIAAIVTVGTRPHQQQREKRFPRDAQLVDIQTWQNETRRALSLKATLRAPVRDSLAAAVKMYLPSIASRPCAEARRYELAAWTAVFGARPITTLGATELQAQCERWILDGASPTTVNHRLSSLRAVFTARGLPCPTLHRYREPDPKPRGLTREDFEDILAAMPPSQTRAELRVMGETGLPPVRQARLTREDIDLRRRCVYLVGRHKGAGTEPRTMGLTQRGVAAFKEWLAVGCLSDPVQSSTRNVVFQRAVTRANVTRAKAKRPLIRNGAHVKPYDFRHTFGTAAYLATRDLKAVAELLDVTEETATRYALAAVPANVRAIVETLDAEHAKPAAKTGSARKGSHNRRIR